MNRHDSLLLQVLRLQQPHPFDHPPPRQPGTFAFLIRGAFIALFLAASVATAQDAPRSDDALQDLLLHSSAILAASTRDDVELQSAVHLDIAVAEEALVTGRPAKLPLFGKDYLLTLDRSAAGTEGVVTWSGSLHDAQRGMVGDAILTSGGGMYFAKFRTVDGVYRIFPEADVPDTTHVLQKMRQVAAPGVTDFDAYATQSSEHPLPEAESSDDGLLWGDDLAGDPLQPLSLPTTVDVLVLYTPLVRYGKGGTTPTVNWINAMVADFNNTLDELGTTAPRLSLQAAVEVFYWESTSTTPMCDGGACDSIIDDQDWLVTDTTVSALRNAYAADLVVLLTSDSRKSPGAFAHGYAGLKPNKHGGSVPNTTPSRIWGEFVTVRDEYAFSNLTFHHEIGHAFSLWHSDGVETFGYSLLNGQFVERSGPTGHKKPMTMMEARSPICLWSSNTSSDLCHVRLPFFANENKYRMIYQSGFLVPRYFAPDYDVTPHLENGAGIVSQLR